MITESAFTIDQLTNCIQNVFTGQYYDTELVPVKQKDELKDVTKKNGWKFNWKSFLATPEKQVYKLVIKSDDTGKIQGLISIENAAGFVEVHHVENAPDNYGKTKQYAGVCGNLFAFACMKSFDLGNEGFVAWTSKTDLINHYIETLGAQIISIKSHRMFLESPEAKKLVNSYYKDYFNGSK